MNLTCVLLLDFFMTRTKLRLGFRYVTFSCFSADYKTLESKALFFSDIRSFQPDFLFFKEIPPTAWQMSPGCGHVFFGSKPYFGSKPSSTYKMFDWIDVFFVRNYGGTAAEIFSPGVLNALVFGLAVGALWLFKNSMQSEMAAVDPNDWGIGILDDMFLTTVAFSSEIYFAETPEIPEALKVKPLPVVDPYKYLRGFGNVLIHAIQYF